MNKICFPGVITNNIDSFTLFGVMIKATAWRYFNAVKEQAVAIGFSAEQKENLWVEINDLFRQAGYGEKCYGRYIG
jgi:hypothetical protein